MAFYALAVAGPCMLHACERAPLADATAGARVAACMHACMHAMMWEAQERLVAACGVVADDEGKRRPVNQDGARPVLDVGCKNGAPAALADHLHCRRHLLPNLRSSGLAWRHACRWGVMRCRLALKSCTCRLPHTPRAHAPLP